MVATSKGVFFQAPKGRNILKGRWEILEIIFKKANSLQLNA
jgi:hypothetical protein